MNSGKARDSSRMKMVRLEGHTWNSFDFKCFLPLFPKLFFTPLGFPAHCSLSPLNKHHTYKLHAGYFPGLPSLQQHPSGGGSQQYAAGHAGSTLCSHLFTEVVSGQAVPSLLTNKEGISSHSPSYTFSTVWVGFLFL